MKLRLLFLVPSFALSLGCGTLYSVGPHAFVEPPEVPHSESGHRETVYYIEPGSYFHLADDVSSRPLKVSNPPELQQTSFPQLGMNFSLPSRVALGLSGHPVGIWVNDLSFVVKGMAKVQVLGSTPDEKLIEPHLLSFFSHLNWTNVSRSGDQDGLFGRGGYPWSANAEFLGIDAGLSYGYRWSPSLLMYVGLASENFQIRASAHQDASATGDFPAADRSFPLSRGTSWTATGGLFLGSRNRLVTYYSYSETRWNGFLDQHHFVSIGFSILDFDKTRPPLEPIR